MCGMSVEERLGEKRQRRSAGGERNEWGRLGEEEVGDERGRKIGEWGRSGQEGAEE